MVDAVDLDRSHAPHPARGKFIADRPRTGEEVQHVALFEVKQVPQHVEKVLLGEVGRRTRPQVAGRVDRPALVLSADYSHTIRLN